MRYSGAFTFLTILMSACTTPTSTPPDVTAVETFANTELPSLTSSPQNMYVATTSETWWHVFGDPLLNELISKAQVQAFDVRKALADVERAEALLRSARSANMPSLDLAGSLGTLQPDLGASDLAGTASNSAELSLIGNWTIDLFGQARNTIRSAEAGLLATQATQRDIERLIVARTLQAYLTSYNLRVRTQLAEQNIDRLTENTRRIGRLVEEGYSTRLDLRRSESQLFVLEAKRAELSALQTASDNALALLVAIPPADLIAALDAAPLRLNMPRQLPVPDLERVARNRPDIRAAEFALFSASYQADAAQAALYPSISLNSSIFSSGQSIGDLPALSTVSGSLVSSLAAPLIGRGRLLANVDRADADLKKTLIAYEQTVFSAVLEIDTSLAQWKSAQDRMVLRSDALRAAVEAQELAERLFYAGELDFTSVVLAEQTRLQAEDEYLVARGEAFSTYVQYASAVVPGW